MVQHITWITLTNVLVMYLQTHFIFKLSRHLANIWVTWSGRESTASGATLCFYMIKTGATGLLSPWLQSRSDLNGHKCLLKHPELPQRLLQRIHLIMEIIKWLQQCNWAGKHYFAEKVLDGQKCEICSSIKSLDQSLWTVCPADFDKFALTMFALMPGGLNQ